MNLGIDEAIARIAFDSSRTTEQSEKLSAFWQIREYLIKRAHEAREIAESWRNFRVGCSLLALKSHPTDIGDRYHIFVGANVKLAEENGIDMHAEAIAVEAARMAEYNEVIGMVVMGEPQLNEGPAPTLRPCRKCLEFFSHSSLINNDTIILTLTHPEYNPQDFEVHTLRELLE